MMSYLVQVKEELADIQQRLQNMSRVCKVTAVDAKNLRVTVQIDPETEIPDVQFLAQRASDNKTWWLPEVGESGLLSCPSGDLANAIFQPGLNTKDNVPPEAEPTQHVIEWANGDKEIHDYESNSHELSSGNSKRTLNREGVTLESAVDKKIEVNQKEAKVQIGSNEAILNAVAQAIVGALLFPTGVTNLQGATGPIFFTPSPPPASAPSPPAGTPTNAKGEVTGTPPTQINSVTVRVGSNLTLVLPAIPVVTSGGAGNTTPGTYKANVTGTLNITIPSRSF